MKKLLLLLLFFAALPAFGQKTGTTTIIGQSGTTCNATSGTLTLSATLNRQSGISPLTIWVDATATTDSSLSGSQTPFNDDTITVDFGDPLASGTGTWQQGSNPGVNSLNKATGMVTAHTYVTQGYDLTYNQTVTATNGTNTAFCILGATAFDPSGANGFPTTATTCYSNASNFTGCPTGANHVSSQATVPSLAVNGVRKLFHCGDTFTTAQQNVNGTKGTIGAYDSCVGTTTNRPIFQATAAPDGLMDLNNPSTDIRITDIVFDGNNQAGIWIFDDNNNSINTGNKLFQYTFYNIQTKNAAAGILWKAGGQMAIVNSRAEAILNATQQINVFTNYAGVGNGATGAGTACGAVCNWSASGPSEDFLFLGGNFFENGVSAPANNTAYETFRDSFGTREFISNNTMGNAGPPTWAVFKYHNLNFSTDCGGTFPGCGGWSGLYTQLDVISDNYFFGSSGTNCTEITPQNSTSDERMRYIVVERNLFNCTENGGRNMLASGTNITYRDNVFEPQSGSYGIEICQRGIEPAPQFLEIFNNTFSGGGASPAIRFSAGATCGGTSATTNSLAENNLIFNGAVPTNPGGGSGITISNNTTTTSNNPGFVDAGGSFLLISDFKPTANYTGAANGVPVIYDGALSAPNPYGVLWSPTWDLGAVHH